MRKKILVIDDEADIVELLCSRLHAEHYETVSAFDGEDGLSKFKAEMPDLVILDLTMPHMNGLEVCRIIRREEDNNTPIIMLTAKNTDIDRIVGRVRGADVYMTKPFDARAVISQVNMLLNHKKITKLT
ncbi:MAG: response regulator [Candidatus Omnitrophica bacterium]|nr:response regulator [Candidatus Omnitrophota bacterium]